MEYKIIGELICFPVVLIVLIYSYYGNTDNNLKFKVFRGIVWVNLISILYNIIALGILNNGNISEISSRIILIGHYLLMVAIPLTFFYYAVSVIIQSEKKFSVFWLLPLIPFILLAVILVVANCFIGGDTAGAGKGLESFCVNIVYLTYCVYGFGCIIIYIFNRIKVERSSKSFFMFFPLFTVIQVLLYKLFPDYVLSGFTGMMALVILYLFVQNKRLSLDKLTGAFNRESFMSRMEEFIRIDLEFTSVSISLREFKSFNDKYGQAMGDEFLKTLAEYLQRFTLAHCIFRTGGDVFTILVESKRIQGDKDEIVKEIKKRMNEKWEINGEEFMVNAAIASVEYPHIAKDVIEILGGIKLATEVAKETPGTNYCICSKKILESAKRKIEIGNVLKAALANDGFEVYYQPIWNEEKQSFVLIEALLRLNNTSMGNIYPDEFIPIAEEIGLLPEITFWVLDKSCKMVKSLENKCCTLPAIVSVNFSSGQFSDQNLKDKVKEVINKNDIEPGKIKIEITERTIVDNPDTVRSFMHEMHEVGIGFSLDDFGTGYSNLALILQLPFEIIKIDKSIVWQAFEDDDSTQFLANLIHAFNSFGMTVVSEGVENEEQKALVLNCGCDTIQGFLYSRPLRESQLLELLCEKRKEECDGEVREIEHASIN